MNEQDFETAALALVVELAGDDAVDAFEPRQIAASGATDQDRLSNFLAAVRALIVEEHFVPARFEVIWLDGDTICAQLLGAHCDELATKGD